MICKACCNADHPRCLAAGKPDDTNLCPCQCRTGGFTTSTLNLDGSRTEGCYGATGERGSARILGSVDKIMRQMT